MPEKKKYELEYIIKTSANVLYKLISTADGLSEWFAESVSEDNENLFTFTWGYDSEEARMIASKQAEFARFQWMEDEEEDLESYFEFKITLIPSDPKNILFTISDFAEDTEMEASQMFWEKQLSILKRKLGA